MAQVISVRIISKIAAGTMAGLLAFAATGATAHAATSGQSNKNVPISKPKAPTFPIALGSNDPLVRAAQEAMVRNGFTLRGGVTGSFDKNTLRTLRTFQRVVGLKVTGVIDEPTAKVLKITSTIAPTTTTTTVAPGAPSVAAAATPAPLTIETLPVRGDKSAAVKTVQQALIAKGVTVKGGADGIFGGGTWSALITFQKTNGFEQTGALDFRTALALNLVAAPEHSITTFPTQGLCNFEDTWQAPRPDGRKHLGVDIIAKEGNLLYAAFDGYISKITVANTESKISGNALRLAKGDGTGTYAFYAHLQRFADGLKVGQQVKAGQVIGYVGKTGTTTPHLHFEYHPNGGDAVNPYPIVKAVDACRVTAPLPVPAQ